MLDRDFTYSKMYQNEILFVAVYTLFNPANTAEASGDPGILSENSGIQ